jgi:hypothetical protein
MEEAPASAEPWKVVMLAPIRRNIGSTASRTPESLVPLEMSILWKMAAPVGRLVPRPAGVPPQHRVLMPEHQQLSILRQVTAEHQAVQAEYLAREQVDDLEQHAAS